MIVESNRTNRYTFCDHSIDKGALGSMRHIVTSSVWTATSFGFQNLSYKFRNVGIEYTICEGSVEEAKLWQEQNRSLGKSNLINLSVALCAPKKATHSKTVYLTLGNLTYEISIIIRW